MEGDRPLRRRIRAPLAILVVLSAVLASAAGAGIWYYETGGHSGSGLKADGPTFYQAITEVNDSVVNETGGPWTLYAVWGIASPTPFSPNALGWSSYNQTVNSCGSQFNGLTLWNGSIPLFNGTFDSGTAPFWQFGFFSNSSQAILIATNVLGVPRVYPPMAMSSPCASASGLGGTPWGWAHTLSPFPSDSPTMAESSWTAIGERWTTANQPAYETFVLGFGYWGSGNPSGLIVKFARCGEVGATGVQPVADVILNSNGSWNSVFNGTQGCGDVISLGPPPVYGQYLLNFSIPQISHAGSTELVGQSFQVTYGSAPPVDADAGGLVTWMTNLSLSDDSKSPLPSVNPDCASWVPSLADCSAGGSGWYAILLSSNGSWLDAYPSLSGNVAWEIPNVSLASNQFLAVIVPSSWGVTGDILSINGTVPGVVVSGSVAL
jgi:hypothetical protein